MAFTARQEAILRAVRRDGAVRVAAMAAALRVSQMSVRRDINALVEAGIVDRVHGGAVLASTETGAQPQGAGIPPRGRPLCLGMIVPAPSLYFQQLVQGARVAAESLGAQLRIGFSGYDDDEDHALVGRMLDDHLDGLLLTPSSSLKETRPTLDWLAARGIPAVIVERRREATAAVDCFDYVSSDHEHGTLQALRHLVDGGHRRIALLTRPSTTSHWIRQAFDIATDHYDLPRDVPRVVTVHPQAEAEAGAQVAHVLDAIAESGATAVVAHPDPHAIMLIQQAQLRGRAIPEDLAVVAYDDELAALADIPLTAVAPPRQAVGRIAVSRLVQRIRDGSAHVPQHILIPPRLNIRASTGG
ncbi:substrate-binding domain-containing protein [Streptomyces sp. NPDC059881]|uniref:substrate-binding domain-containing protein n=1 Tax=Streptomyces sp. NPDC059881 TaxID=3346986 RepID=UPI00365E0A26